mgnify:CR=1
DRGHIECEMKTKRPYKHAEFDYLIVSVMARRARSKWILRGRGRNVLIGVWIIPMKELKSRFCVSWKYAGTVYGGKSKMCLDFP